MKLYKNTTLAVIKALTLIFVDHKYADKVIEKVLKENPKWGSRDRKFIAETTYNIVRWYRLLAEVGRTGNHDFWKLLEVYFILHKIDLPDWPELGHYSSKEIADRMKKVEGIRKIKNAVPDWLDELAEKELGPAWDREIISLNEEAPVVLRANTLKISKQHLQKKLLETNIETDDNSVFPDALILKERQNIFLTPSFKEGLFEIQDAASQLIAPFLSVEPGMRVIDACAGSGGKTLHIAALMKNKGRIIAMDVEQWKLEELSKRARRASVSNLEVKLIDSSKIIKRLAATADRLLLDVPCSGIGVLKRNPDAKWKLSIEFIDKVKAMQQTILQDYSIMVKPGGVMVYATCSILPSENEEQVKLFLSKNAGIFELIREQRAWPSEGFDGFYMAAIKRIGG